MDLGLKDKVAAVAAASQGLGFAAARQLAREGAKLGICSRSADNVEQARKRIAEETGADVFTYVTDLATAGGAAAFVDSVAEHFGALHVLVTNAGGPPAGGFEQIGHEQLERGFNLTMMSSVAMIKTAVPRMREQKWGRIVNVLSITAKQPELTLLVSNTMRAGLVGYTKSISQELAAENVLVNNVAPGYTRTERLGDLADHLSKQSGKSVDEVYAEWEKHIPMGRLANPEEFGNVVAFLCSQPASYVTGVTLQVDGGFVKGLL